MKFSAPIVIFVRPQAAGNVGAMARVMSNFACQDLRLVGEPIYKNEDSIFADADWLLACKGEDILKSARVHESLEEALDGVHFAIGTSARPRENDTGYARKFGSFKDALSAFHTWSLSSELVDKKKTSEKKDIAELKWAILIGSENHGMNDIECGHCHFLVGLPTHAASPSMNAAMALGCMLYEWTLINSEEGQNKNVNEESAGIFPSRHYTEKNREKIADSHEIEKFLKYAGDTLDQTGFFKHPDRDASMARLRRWMQQSPIPVGELLFAFEALYHVQSKLNGRFDKRNFLK